MNRLDQICVLRILAEDVKEMVKDDDNFLNIILDSLNDAERQSCPHFSIKRSHDSCVCIDCEKDFGWWCPDSPDHMCYYFNDGQIDGRYYVTLLNGEKYLLPENYDGDNESDDWCIFCGQPKERK